MNFCNHIDGITCPTCAPPTKPPIIGEIVEIYRNPPPFNYLGPKSFIHVESDKAQFWCLVAQKLAQDLAEAVSIGEDRVSWVAILAEAKGFATEQQKQFDEMWTK